MLCCLTACVGSLIFGYNIGVTNLPTPVSLVSIRFVFVLITNNRVLLQLIKEFFAQKYFPEYYQKLNANKDAIETQEKLNHYMQELLNITLQRQNSFGNKNVTEELNQRSQKLEEDVQKFLNESVNNNVKIKIENHQKRLNASHPDWANIKEQIEKEKPNIDDYMTKLWTITTSLFVVGGMIGAFTSKYVVDYFGRKKVCAAFISIRFHYAIEMNSH